MLALPLLATSSPDIACRGCLTLGAWTISDKASFKVPDHQSITLQDEKGCVDLDRRLMARTMRPILTASSRRSIGTTAEKWQGRLKLCSGSVRCLILLPASFERHNRVQLIEAWAERLLVSIHVCLADELYVFFRGMPLCLLQSLRRLPEWIDRFTEGFLLRRLHAGPLHLLAATIRGICGRSDCRSSQAL